MDYKQLKEYILEPVLKDLSGYKSYLYSEERINLALGIIAQESHYTYIKQIGGGPACGLIQMEPETAKDIINNYLKYRTKLNGIVMSYYNQNMSLEQNLTGNLYFQIAMLYVHILRAPEKLPTTIDGFACYWKKYYNTPLGKGTEEEFVDNYNEQILGIKKTKLGE